MFFHHHGNKPAHIYSSVSTNRTVCLHIIMGILLQLKKKQKTKSNVCISMHFWPKHCLWGPVYCLLLFFCLNQHVEKTNCLSQRKEMKGLFLKQEMLRKSNNCPIVYQSKNSKYNINNIFNWSYETHRIKMFNVLLSLYSKIKKFHICIDVDMFHFLFCLLWPYSGWSQPDSINSTWLAVAAAAASGG